MTQTVIHLETQAANGYRIWRGALLGIGLAAATYCLSVALIMLAAHHREQAYHPLTLAAIPELRNQLAETGDEELRQRLWEKDRDIRQAFFERRSFMHRGSYLLLGGAIVLVISLKLVYQLSAKPYMPDPATHPFATLPLTLRWTRMAVIGAAAATAAVFLAMASMPRFQLPSFEGELAKLAAANAPAVGQAPTATVEVTVADYAKNWPSFRGFGGSGIVSTGEYVTDWDGASGRNILWKTPIPLLGHNSPVIWGQHIFLTGATREKRELYCFDRTTGQLKWKQPVGSTTPGEFDVTEGVSYAPNTVATDGARVYAIFPTGDLAAFDFSGKKLWSKNLGWDQEDNTYGHASSLLAYRNRVFVQFDRGHDEEHFKSTMLCFDGPTGKQVWEAKRPVLVAWSTPILAQTPSGPQVIAAGHPLVIAHDPETGSEIWRAKWLQSGGEVAPSPVYVNGVAYLGLDREDLVAIKTDGKGDVTKSHILYRSMIDLPDIVSPLATGEFVFSIQTSGNVICADARTGEEVWQHLFESPDPDTMVNFNASPTLIGKNVYLTDTNGLTYIFEAAREFKLVATCKLDEPIRASPAVLDGKIYLRGEKHLYCIGSK